MSLQPLIANKLLAFIKHAIDYMDEVSILRICKSNFKEAVRSCYCSINSEKSTKCSLTGGNQEEDQKSVQDIIIMIKSTDPDDVPDFIAKELHKLSPVSFDHVDVTRLLKDITFLKASLAEVQFKLEVSNSTIRELHDEVELLRNAVSKNRSPNASDVNIRRRAQNASIGSFDSASSTTSPAAILHKL